MEQWASLNLLAPNQNNWILQMNYRDIIQHQDRQVLTLSGETGEINEPSALTHIFFSYMTKQQLVALILTKAGQFILINNQVEVEVPKPEEGGELEGETGERLIKLNEPIPVVKGIQSTLTILDRPDDLMNRKLLSGSMQKQLGLKEWNRSRNCDKVVTSNSTYVDLIGLTKTKTLLPKAYDLILQTAPDVNFQHIYYLSEKQLSHLPQISTVKMVKFNQNGQIRDFSWMSKFPNLRGVSFDQCQQLNDGLVSQVIKSCPVLEEMTFRYCCTLNIRVFLALLNSSSLRRLDIDYPNFHCQISPKDVLVSHKEWKSVCSLTLHTLMMNSEDLTLDVLDYILKSCTELRDLYLNDQVLKMVSKNIVFSENDIRPDNVVNFHSYSDHRKGFRAGRPMTFKNMFKNLCSAPFSRSMLGKIRQSEMNNPELLETVAELGNIPN